MFSVDLVNFLNVLWFDLALPILKLVNISVILLVSSLVKVSLDFEALFLIPELLSEL